ncbi:MAG TPA: hypothetical protein VF297_22450 [Pyrinomonadaceae bacterium]
MTTYIRDLIELPDRVRRGDFVLRLTEGVTRPEDTVNNYVVTPQLVSAFDEALGLIRSAVESRSSKASYLHGSFGSGKSHFMAILHLLLQNNSHARSIPELAEVVARHNAWTQGRKFLLVPYHMVGATDMESSILGGYADYVRRVHPEASTPGVYRAEEIFADARRLRQTMGDEAFFAELGAGAAGGDGWGDIGAGWDAASFDAALNAPPRSEDRSRLVGDLVEKFFTAARGANEFIDLDTGLSVISRHAKSLGYDALILFLDELILWLASHAADVTFVSREGQKLAKLVEAQSADRPAPVISFVARQRDLKELVGDQIVGAQLLAFSDVLKYWEARFHKITLEDRNLPAIAERRVLKPKSEAARQQMDDAFRTTEGIRAEVMNVLLTSDGDRAMFRKVYPFSPALVETLVAVSFLLQRERTALKVMLQLLVEQQDRLRLGDIVPVGDLFDAISEGDEAFSDVMKVHFENAKKLYQQKLRPILERDLGLKFEALADLPADDLRAKALRNDDRLVKTLLLSALAPNVESLKGLTASRLAALNHGTIQSPIPGRETQLVVQKCRRWAAEVGQIKIGDEPPGNPTISVQLTGVDTESIIQQAQSEDNQGNRVRKIKDLLFEQLGVRREDSLLISHDFTWRATKRSCEVLFANVRDVPDSSLDAQGEMWRVIIDYPFDTEGHGPSDDVARLERYQTAYERPSRTLVWIPSFLSRQARRELGTLVILDHILKGERFNNYVTHLSPVDRASARSLLENQQSQLRQRMINYLEGAYGIVKAAEGSLDPAHQLTVAESFHSLDPGFALQPPVGASLKEAFDHLLDQALRHQYPAHPLFDGEARLNMPALRRVYEVVERATEAPDGRLAVEQPQRREVRQIVNPLKVGEMHETHFILLQHWKTHFLRKEAEDGGPLTVAKLRAWLDEPKPMGLPRELQSFVIISFAAQTNRTFSLHGGPYRASLESLPDELELREQSLPEQGDWDAAVKRAASIFGVAASPLMNAANVAKFAADVKAAATQAKPACDELVDGLRKLLPTLSGGAETTRYGTARAVKGLVDAASKAGSDDVVRAVAGAEVFSSEAAMGTSLKKASEVSGALSQINWVLFEAVGKLDDSRADAARAIAHDLGEAFQKDEYAIAFRPTLVEVQERAMRLLADVSKPAPRPEPAPIKRTGHSVISEGKRDNVTAEEFDAIVEELRKALSSDGGPRLDLTWEVYRP